MRLLAFLFAILTMATSASAEGVQFYLIENEAGELLGWQRETDKQDGAAGHSVTERQLAYRVDGHGLQRQYLRVETGTENDHPVVTMGTVADDARRVVPHSVNDLSLLNDVVAVAKGATRAGFRLLNPGASTNNLVEQRIGSRFVAAWLVERDENGRVSAIRQPRLEGDWIFRPASDSPMPLLLGLGASMAHPMVDAPYDIPGSARRGHIRYILSVPLGVGLPLPETTEQRITQRDGDLLQVDICKTCGPDLPASDDDPSRWKQPTVWLESEAPELRQVAARARRGAKSDMEVMRRLSRTARIRLKDVDYDGHYSALSAWHRRRGDCTEDAVLLAALARAAGIPARVVTGLAYEREAYHGTANAFLPHAWTLAYVDGQWRSFDLSLGRVSAGHIAMAITDGEASAIQSGWQLAALIELQDMAEVRTAPSATKN